MLQAFIDSYLGRRQLTVFRYHGVLPAFDPLRPEETTREVFNWQMAVLKQFFNVLPFAEAVRRLQDGCLPPRAVTLTFDDGYADNAEIALPILKKYRLPATFFIISGAFDGKPMWNDRIIEMVRQCSDNSLDLSAFDLGNHTLADDAQRNRAIERIIQHLKYTPLAHRMEIVDAVMEATATRLPRLMMSAEQAKAMRDAGMEIGAHTVNHPILSKLENSEALREIADGKACLEHLLGEKIMSFAYPNGKPDQDYGGEHVVMLKKLGFKQAVSTSWGVCRQGMDPLQLPRMAPSIVSKMHFVGRVWQNARIVPDFAQAGS